MNFGICNELFEGWEFGRVCDFAAKAGYDAVEVAPFTLPKPPAELSRAERKEMVRDAERASVSVVGLHWLLAKTEGFYVNHPDAGIRNKTAEYLGILAELCADLGGSIMVFGSPKQRSVYEGLDYTKAFDLAAETFGAVTPTLKKTGVTLCIEPLGPEETDFINTADEAVRLVEKIGHPNFQLMVDVKAMSTEGKPIPEIIHANAPYIRHVHANDANRRGPGFGSTDFRPIFTALDEIGFDGCVSVEVFDYSPDPETIAQRSIEYMKSCMA